MHMVISEISKCHLSYTNSALKDILANVIRLLDNNYNFCFNSLKHHPFRGFKIEHALDNYYGSNIRHTCDVHLTIGPKDKPAF